MHKQLNLGSFYLPSNPLIFIPETEKLQMNNIKKKKRNWTDNDSSI